MPLWSMAEHVTMPREAVCFVITGGVLPRSRDSATPTPAQPSGRHTSVATGDDAAMADGAMDAADVEDDGVSAVAALAHELSSSSTVPLKRSVLFLVSPDGVKGWTVNWRPESVECLQMMLWELGTWMRRRSFLLSSIVLHKLGLGHAAGDACAPLPPPRARHAKLLMNAKLRWWSAHALSQPGGEPRGRRPSLAQRMFASVGGASVAASADRRLLTPAIASDGSDMAQPAAYRDVDSVKAMLRWRGPVRSARSAQSVPPQAQPSPNRASLPHLQPLGVHGMRTPTGPTTIAPSAVRSSLAPRPIRMPAAAVPSSRRGTTSAAAAAAAAAAGSSSMAPRSTSMAPRSTAVTASRRAPKTPLADRSVCDRLRLAVCLGIRVAFTHEIARAVNDARVTDVLRLHAIQLEAADKALQEWQNRRVRLGVVALAPGVDLGVADGDGPGGVAAAVVAQFTQDVLHNSRLVSCTRIPILQVCCEEA
jgi:hypothetical protein